MNKPKKQTITVKISKAIINRHAKDESTYQLKDPRHNLYLRFHQSREKATWYFVKYAQGKAIWHNLGAWPTINSDVMLDKLPDLVMQLAVKHDDKSVGLGQFVTVSHLLEWFLSRSQASTTLSSTRKRAIKSAISKHLAPRLGDFDIDQLTKAVIDQHLIQALQANYKPSYLKSIFAMLKAIFNQASKLSLLKVNVLSDFYFKDFIQTDIQPKPTAIRTDQLPQLLTQLPKGEVEHQALVLLQLLHATRIGETRRTKWSELNLIDGLWFIPAERTKTKVEHRLPLTTQAIGFLTAYQQYQIKQGYQGAFLFPNQRNAISENIANQWVQQISNKLWTSHSLRKVASSTLLDLGVQDFIRDMILNHALSDLKKTYIHTYVEKQIKEALSLWHNHLLECGLFFLHHNNITKNENMAQSAEHHAITELNANQNEIIKGVY